MKMKSEINFSEFLDYFPKVDLPIALSDAIIHEISKVNKVFPAAVISQYFSTWDDQIDETSEFLPCCQLPEQEDFYALIYWKASLMSYEFILATFDKKGQLIQKKLIAGMSSNGSTILQSVAKIEDDLSIHIVTGEQAAEQQNYDPSFSKAYYMEILPNGQLISSKDEEMTWQEKNTNREN